MTFADRVILIFCGLYVAALVAYGVTLDSWMWFADKVWNIPSGIATIFAGSFVVIAAAIAWTGAQKQIRSQISIESDKRRHEREALETALAAELLVCSRSIIEACSLWNSRAHSNPSAPANPWPVFTHPRVYEATVEKIGLLAEGWPAAALIT